MEGDEGLKHRSGEFARIARLASIYGAGGAPLAEGVAVGMGDDAAVLAPPAGERLVWTVDEQVDGTHFRRDLVSLRDIGYRALMAAASDVAAMGARPWCALSSLVLPEGFADAELFELAEGTREAAAEIGASLVGGNLARGPALAVSTSVLGAAARPIERRGARAGDGLYVAGPLGLAAAGLRALLEGVRDPRIDAAVAAWRRPRARVAAGLQAAIAARALVDVSDGLAQDVAHLARASGVAVVIDAAALLTHAGPALAAAAAALGADALELCLHGGEDYALVATAGEALAGFTRIGDVRKENREGPSVVLREARGERAIAAAGFDHFAAR